MTILIDLVLGNHAAIFDDLLQIVRCDPGLTTSQPTPYVLQLAYQQKQQSTASSYRLLQLANHPTNILIIGVNNLFVLPNGLPITDSAAAITPGTLTEPITIYVDVTEAGGQGYHVLDPDRATIYLPRPVTVYHELAHAFHKLQGDEPATSQAREVQAIHDENAFRAQIYIPLRHPTDHHGDAGPPSHGGQTFPACTPVVKGFNWDCIVASAAVGSPHAPRVDELRRARREYRSLSRWAALVSEPVLDLYRELSPRVVRDMSSDPALRRLMLLYIVQPMLHLLEISETYLRADVEDDDLVAALGRSVDEYLADASMAGVSASALAAAAEGAASAALALARDGGAAQHSGPADRQRGSEAVHSRPAERPEELYAYLASAIVATAGKTDGYGWAFAGIDLFLRESSARRADADHRWVAPPLLDAVGAWLARLPIPSDALMSIVEARTELEILAERVFTRPRARTQFAQHLLLRWPADSTPALRAVLGDLRYLAPEPSRPSEEGTNGTRVNGTP